MTCAPLILLETHFFFSCSVSPRLDGGVWQSSLPKTPFPSGPVDQFTQKTLCQVGWPLAERHLCQVSLMLSAHLLKTELMSYCLLSGFVVIEPLLTTGK